MPATITVTPTHPELPGGATYHDSFKWTVTTDEGEFRGVAATRQDAFGQARTVALVHGHDERDIAP